MKSIKLKNLRSFEDTGYININGLTVIVGENSSGKSTILRSLPLLKQSIETNTTSPILWYGDYVDFGSFNESVNRNSEDKVIAFSFEIELGKNTDNFFRKSFYGSAFDKIDIGEISKVGVELYISGKEKNDFINFVKIILGDNIIEININYDGSIENLLINKSDFTDIYSQLKFRNPRTGIVPELIEKDNDLFSFRSFYIRNNEDDVFINELVGVIKEKVHPNTSENSILKIIKDFKITSKKKFSEQLKNSDWELNSWHNFLKYNYDEEFIENVRDLFIGTILNGLLIEISDYFNEFSENIHYIAPVRANANRYYRNQNLSVDSVDFRGLNLPMLLANLSAEKKRKFSNWVFENFGFRVLTKMNEGHISINIERNGEVVNMVDCGFGYSQILPIITQLWLLKEKKSHIKRFTLIIEQPELHLHPKMQGNLIDVFSKCINLNNINIIIETHSETIVNRIGYLINKRLLDNKKVNVYILNKYENNTIVKESGYDKNGFLEKWPIGFFNTEDF